MRVLIVDDHSGIRKILRQIVQSPFTSPIDIQECESGNQAVEVFKLFKPDYVLLDIEMSDQDGFTTFSKMKAYASEAKIIFVTGQQTLIYKKRALELHADGFVLKDNLFELLKFFTNT